MNLETNIEIAAEVYAKQMKELRMFGQSVCVVRRNEDFQEEGFIAGAKSDAAREFWKDQFKLERLADGIIGHIGIGASVELPEILAHDTGRGIIIIGAKGLSREHLHGLAMEDRSMAQVVALLDDELPIGRMPRRNEPLEFKRVNEIPMAQYFEPKEVKPYDRKYMDKRQFKRRK